jgi:thioredoxin reductase (NADPH)
LKKSTDVAIVGGGPAGISAAIWCKRLGLDHLLFETEPILGGQLFAIHNPVIDYPGLRTANGREMQEVFAEHVQELDCVVQAAAEVISVDAAAKVLRVRTAEGAAEVVCRGLIVASGSSERRLQVPGEQEMIERGEVYSASRDRDRFAGRRVLLVGGGDRAFEGALLLAERGAEVVLVHRSDRFRAREELREPVLAHPNIEVLTNATLSHIYGDERVSGAEVRLQDGSERRLEVDAIFVRIGVQPNSHLLRGQVETDADGYVVTDEVGGTSVDGVFAIGDVCTRPLYSSIASAVGQGMAAAKHLSLFLAQKGEEL